jgi:catechol 2,3-dioxygenase-like lactoylglutathione lyase family enzyme
MSMRNSGFDAHPGKGAIAIAAVFAATMVTTATLAATPRAAGAVASPAPGVAVEAPVQVPAPVMDTDPSTVVPGSKAVARRLTAVVADLGKTKRFYEALGFREDRRAEVSDAASLSVFGLDPGARLTFIRMTMDNTLSTGRIDGGTLGFAQVHNRPLPRLRDATRGETMIGMPILVMTTDGIDAVHARLGAIGAEIVAPPFPAGGGLTSMIVRDPDGLRMEISQPARPAR